MLQRDVLVALYSLVHIAALGLVRRPHRPLLDAVDALTALDASLALMPSSNLAAAAAPIVADTHNTLYRHLSLLLSLYITRGRIRLCAHVTHHHVMLVARRHRAHALIISSRLARHARQLVVHLEPARRPHLAARPLGLSAICTSDQLGRRTASSSSSPPSSSSCDQPYCWFPNPDLT